MPTIDSRSSRIAAGLQASGVVPGSVVALLLDRSADAIVAILGILKAGAAYLPLDAAHPAEHLAFAIRDARAPVVICKDAAHVAIGNHRANDHSRGSRSRARPLYIAQHSMATPWPM